VSSTWVTYLSYFSLFVLPPSLSFTLSYPTTPNTLILFIIIILIFKELFARREFISIQLLFSSSIPSRSNDFTNSMSKVHDVTTCAPNHGSTNGGTRVYFYGTFNPPAEASTRNFYQIRFDRDSVVPAVYEPEHHHLYCHTPPHSAAIAVTIEIKAEAEVSYFSSSSSSSSFLSFSHLVLMP
jgi:hypothetical protein